ncbi:MAG: hypothetical protein LQ345_001833 [Seirophora villosa]|nr:MAG: hypothetical protein LQ345_001833 [Seirophora villosa]
MGGGKVPDAWDDDWIEKADSPAPANETGSKPVKLSKAERRAKQAEFNRQIWEDAEAPNQSFFLSTRTEVPLKSEFKPAMKVLSRKPETASGALGPGQLSLDNEDQDEDNDEGKARPLTAEERQLKTQQEREEKQKKYEEARQRLFGVSHASTSKPSGSTTPPRQKANGEVRGSSRTRGTRDPRHLSSSGAAAGPARQLYDPSYSAKVDATFPKKRDETFDAFEQQQPIRAPRGPDGSGRGGFGFAPRGGNLS